jgi:lipopolysaccharide export system ATP-binding protein
MKELIAKNLAKKYRNRWAVSDISIKLNNSEIVGLLGPNGAGKTTSFYMIVGLIRPNKGSVCLNNDKTSVDLTRLPLHKRAQMGLGYLPQENSIFRKLSVKDNIMAILELQKDLTLEQRNEKLAYLLDEFHLTHLSDNLGYSLSGGERRRTEIARALATSPQFILLDEPFAGVDPISVIDIKRIIKQLNQKGIGILITDHNVRETLDICHRAYIVNNGEIIAQGSSDEVLSNEQVKKVYLGEGFKI